MGLLERFSVNSELVSEEDIVVLKSDFYDTTYRFKQPIEVPWMPGFYLIPEHTRYCIDRKGRVYSFIRNKILKYRIDKDPTGKRTRGYFKISIKSDIGNRAPTTSRHRLKMITFTEYSHHPKDKMINHIDGIPGNDDLDNLEWCDNGHNIRHAIANGLIFRNILSVDVKNINTGEEFSTRTITDASRRSGVTVGALTGRLRSQHHRPADGWVIKLADDDWVELDEGVRSRKSNTPVTAWDVKSNIKYTYPSLTDAAKILGFNKALIRSQCVDKAMSPAYGFVFRYSLDEATFPIYTREQLEWFKTCDYPSTMQTDGYAVYLDKSLVYVGSLESVKEYINFEMTVRTLRNMIVRGDNTFGDYTVDIIPSGGSLITALPI